MNDRPCDPHEWLIVGISHPPTLDIRCRHCQQRGVVTKPTSDEISLAFYASPTSPVGFTVDRWQAVTIRK